MYSKHDRSAKGWGSISYEWEPCEPFFGVYASAVVSLPDEDTCLLIGKSLSIGNVAADTERLLVYLQSSTRETETALGLRKSIKKRAILS